MEQGKVQDRCPACGVNAKMFQPHDERISSKRKFLLSLDLHPVLVHFPQAFSATILLLACAGLIFPPNVHITATMHLLGCALPGTVLAAFAAGIFDGKIRFRRTTTPILIKKMAVGGLFFLFACGIAVIVTIRPLSSSVDFLITIALSFAALGCATGLGFLGTSILNSRFPG